MAWVAHPRQFNEASKTMKLKPFEIRMPIPPQGGNRGPPSQPASGLANGAAEPVIREPASADDLRSVQSENAIHRWIEAMEESVVVLDAGIIVESNRRAPMHFGRSDGEIQGLHIKELVANESLMRLAHFLEFDDPEPTLVLGLRKDRRTFPLQLKAVASIVGKGRRLRVTMLTRCGAVERAVDPTTTPPEESDGNEL